MEYVARSGLLLFTTAVCIAVVAFAWLGRKRIRAQRQQALITQSKMPPTPRKLDGGVVLSVAFRNADQDFGIYQDENGQQPIAALALVGYPARRGIVYVFACNSAWEVIGDLLFDSGESAIEGAEHFYNVHSISWEPVGSITEEMRRRAEKEEAEERAKLPADYSSDQTISALLRDGLELEAIARLRMRRGLSLLDATNYIDRLKREGRNVSGEPSSR